MNNYLLEMFTLRGNIKRRANLEFYIDTKDKQIRLKQDDGVNYLGEALIINFEEVETIIDYLTEVKNKFIDQGV